MTKDLDWTPTHGSTGIDADIEFLESLQERLMDIHGRYDAIKFGYNSLHDGKIETYHIGDYSGALVDSLSDLIGVLTKYAD